jgi:hypothetical protein
MIALGVMLVGVVVTVPSAVAQVGGGADKAARTLVFRVPPAPPRDHVHVDVPPHGLSLGDRDLGAVSLRRNGALFGRALVVCTINDASFEGLQCDWTLVLRKGQITGQGGGLDRKLPHAPSPGNDVFAVTGGTGIYTGASGTLTIRHGSHADFFTVTLQK